MDDDLGLDEPFGDNEPDDDLLDYQQDGPGLFDEPLADPEPACDIKAAAGEVSGGDPTTGEDADQASDTLVAEPAALAAAAPPTPAAPELAAPPAAALDTAAMARPTAPLALYRRYRPDSFDEVIGQEHVTEPLSRAIANNKVNHAYLFSGPRGCGKTTSARILARCLNCAQGPTPTPCGICDSCVALATGGPGSIDVIEIDAASHGRVDDARELREGVYFAPVSSRYKIYIIDEAHMVTKEGFNALLKVVEEPPEHVKFIFATTEPEKVIGTIRSRTHHYPFRLVPPRTLASYLEKICAEEGVEVERGVLPLVVRAGAGSVRDSLSVLDQLLGAASAQGVSYAHATALLGYTPDTLLDEIVDAFAAGDGQGVFATIDKVIEVGQDPRRFAEDLLERMRDLVIVAQVPEALNSGLIEVSADQAERLAAQASALGAGELTRAAEVIATGLVQMRGTTAPRLHLELICARVLLPTADADGRGLHARLDRLERRLDMPDLVPGRSAEPAAPRGWDDEPAAQPSARPSEAPAQRPPADQRPSEQQRPAADQRPIPEQQRPAEQRPAQRPPAEQRPAPEQRPASEQQQRPAEQPQQRPAAQPAAEAEAPRGQVNTADLRRLWPTILEEVKSRKRFSHALISQNAQVIEVRGRELLLGFPNQPTLDHFQGGGSADVLRDSIIEVLGADLHINASVDGGQAGSGPASRPVVEQRPAQRPAAEPAEPAEPAQPASQQQAVSNRAAQARAAAAQQSPDEPSEPPFDDQIDVDDVVLDESGEDTASLLARELGAQIIEETDN